MPDPLSEALRRLPLFAALTPTELAPLATRCRRRTFPPREALFHEGDIGQTLYLILSGYVVIQRITPEGAMVHIARRGPGEHFGELALLDDQPRSADAVTETTCDLLMLDRRDLLTFLEAHPSASWAILRNLAARLREASDRLLQQESRSVLERLAAALWSEIDALPKIEAGVVRLTGVSDSDLAHRIGATRETVNRRLAQLRQQGILRREGSTLVILKPERLRHHAADMRRREHVGQSAELHRRHVVGVGADVERSTRDRAAAQRVLRF